MVDENIVVEEFQPILHLDANDTTEWFQLKLRKSFGKCFAVFWYFIYWHFIEKKSKEGVWMNNVSKKTGLSTSQVSRFLKEGANFHILEQRGDDNYYFPHIMETENGTTITDEKHEFDILKFKERLYSRYKEKTAVMRKIRNYNAEQKENEISEEKGDADGQ